MPLSLIVEDGTGLPNSNSYVSVGEVRAYLAQRGIDVPTDDDTLIQFMTTALDFLGNYDIRWKGEQVFPEMQALPWPRANVFMAGRLCIFNIIPQRLKNAQCYLTGAATTIDLNAAQDTRAIIRDKIGPLETDYSPTAGATLRPILPLLEGMLQPLLNAGTGMLRANRV